MSGLIRFFGGFFPSGTSIDATHKKDQPDNGFEHSPLGAETAPQNESDDDAAYRQSLSSFVSCTRSSLSRSPSSSLAPVITGASSYDVWKEERNEALRAYMECRMLQISDEDGNDVDDEVNQSDDEEYIVPDNDEIDAPFWNTQQEASQPTSEANLDRTTTPDNHRLTPTSAPPSTIKKSPRNRIPRVQTTVQQTTSLSQLSLHTKELHLSLCRIDRIWGLRDTRRRNLNMTSTRDTPVEAPHELLPLRRYKSFDDDGPLGTLYRQVLTLQITPLEEPIFPKHIWDRNKRHDQPRELRVFFYNKYASRLADFLDSYPSDLRLLSLHHVPAKCILPYGNDGTWYEKFTLAPYCVCIGDSSSMKMQLLDGEVVKIPFDVSNLRVTVARLPSTLHDANVTVLTPETVKQAMKVEQGNEVIDRYQTWEKSTSECDAHHSPKEPMVSDAHHSPKEPMDSDAQQQAEDTGPPTCIPDEQAHPNTDEIQTPVSRMRLPSAGDHDDRSSKRPKTHVDYHKMDDLRHVFETHRSVSNSDTPALFVNVFATVVGFSSPCLTKVNDWMLNVSVMDETSPLPTDEGDDGIDFATTVVFFCRERHQLPQFLMAGDVIRMRHVVLQGYKGQVQILGRRSSSFVVVRPKDAHLPTTCRNNWDGLPTVEGDITFSPDDVARASELWHWSQMRLASYPTMKKSQRFTLADLTRQEHYESSHEVASWDLTLMVSAILPVPPTLKTQSMPLGFLRVWDGTGLPVSDPLPIGSSLAAQSVRNGDPPPEALASIASVIRAFEGDSQDGDVASAENNAASSLEAPKSLCGRVCNVAVWEEPHWDLVMSAVHVGKFIRLRNVQESRLLNGLKCLMIASKSWLTPLPDKTYEVHKMLQEHHMRILRKDPFNPLSGILPLESDARPSNAEIATRDVSREPVLIDLVSTDIADDELISSVAHCIWEPAPSSLNISFQITRTIPTVGDGEFGLRNLCAPSRHDASGGNMIYQFAIHVKDSTGEIDAIVSDNVGESLFGLDANSAWMMPTSRANNMISQITAKPCWNGEIRSVTLNGAKYFVLASLTTR